MSPFIIVCWTLTTDGFLRELAPAHRSKTPRHQSQQVRSDVPARLGAQIAPRQEQNVDRGFRALELPEHVSCDPPDPRSRDGPPSGSSQRGNQPPRRVSTRRHIDRQRTLRRPRPPSLDIGCRRLRPQLAPTAHTVKRWRPFARRRLITFWPSAVLMRLRKP